ncbi:hypothetical protein Sala_3013 [Sphingopyxis alaskensis RB2256]|uniref:Uncharacterized protein n=1 Tax=Sphingopyxis alaskensis (strain DSM 13593 / LMG 18877 / RB2256) TaxID=317655 RepID=Q1GNQ4_SPHAL|nr:hypothetical protein Sala_3013 [Sphingopyxis alaskensis RB2256]
MGARAMSARRSSIKGRSDPGGSDIQHAALFARKTAVHAPTARTAGHDGAVLPLPHRQVCRASPGSLAASVATGVSAMATYPDSGAACSNGIKSI